MNERTALGIVAVVAAMAIGIGVGYAVGNSSTSTTVTRTLVTPSTQVQECIPPPVRPATNVPQLDQPQGSDVNASNSTTPIIYWSGDGNKASYAVSMDGVSIGTVFTDLYANTCLFSAQLSEGQHTLTGTELLPHAGLTLTPYTFTVDTTPPTPPSTPQLASYSDSCYANPPASGCIATTQPVDRKGDNATIYPNPALIGLAIPRSSVTLIVDGHPNGGAAADANGNYTIRPNPLAPGVHVLSVVGFDSAGNVSAPSGSLSLTVWSPPGATTTTTTRPSTTTTSTVPPTTTTSTVPPTTTTTSPPPVQITNAPCMVTLPDLNTYTGRCTGTFFPR